MKHKLLFKTFSFFILLSAPLFAQLKPQINFVSLLETSETNPVNKYAACLTALELNQPWSIYTADGVFIEALAVENQKPVYAVITNLINPYNGGYTAFFEEINSRYNLSKARVIYSKENILNPHIGEPAVTKHTDGTASFIMFMQSTGKRVVGLDPITGDVVIPIVLEDAVLLGTPKIARLTPRATITISDQLSDGVTEYDTTGVAMGYFAPVGGVNNAILDNCRGHIYIPNGNLLVSNGSGTNMNTVAEFDNAGNYLGNFIAAGAGSINSPYDILWRANDVIVGGSSSHAMHRYDHTGTYLDDFATGVPFPQQMVEQPNGDIYVADFGVGGGVRIYSSTGSLLSLLNVVTANRGVWLLGNGHILTSNAAGLHELDPATGAVIRTIIPGVSGQWLAPYDRSIFIPVELTSFDADVQNGKVMLNWTTASETNNKGFQVERQSSAENGEWLILGFVKGNGTSAEVNKYSLTDDNITPAKYTYRLKQIDFDGTFKYSGTVEVNYTAPAEFALEQNYPNPFNPATVISFQLPAVSNVTLKVYDVLGNEVAVLVNGMKAAGNYKIPFSGESLNSGIYFYRIQTNNGFIATKKMTIIK
ncbi:MAG: T9SS type A sorting domain-containing protein [Ignavibacteriaceae bacterium]|nr:T9SS type A sorting domain-containing protein [Ignavibacteriaceae bacterium]